MNLEGRIYNSWHFLSLSEAVSWSLGWHQSHYVVKANASTSQELRFHTCITLSGAGPHRWKVCTWFRGYPKLLPHCFHSLILCTEQNLLKYGFFSPMEFPPLHIAMQALSVVFKQCSSWRMVIFIIASTKLLSLSFNCSSATPCF